MVAPARLSPQALPRAASARETPRAVPGGVRRRRAGRTNPSSGALVESTEPSVTTRGASPSDLTIPFVASPDARGQAPIERFLTTLPAAPSLASLERFPSIRRVVEAELSLHIQRGCETLFLPSKVREARGVVVLLHGFQAGTWQFEELSTTFAERGYHVYMPRLAGHGLRHADGTDDATQIPRAASRERWRVFADNVSATVAALGLPVHVVGVAGGAGVALDLATRHPGVQSVGLLEPLFSVGDATSRALVHAAETLDVVTFGGTSRLLERMSTRHSGDANRPGHAVVTLGQLAAVTSIGRDAVENARHTDARIQVLTTDTSEAIDRRPVRKLARSKGRAAGWFHFAASERVQHAMVSPRDNKKDAARKQMREILLASIESGTLTSTPLQGK